LEKASEKGSRKDSFEPTPEELEKVSESLNATGELFINFQSLQIREARKMLQTHNPNYLKSSSPKNSGSDDGSKDAYDNIGEIPIAKLRLDIPLKVHCEFF
jgi:hypothetical protein